MNDDAELQAYYESLLTMFATEGWKEFIKDHKEALDGLMEVSDLDCTTNDKWQYRRGELSQLRKIVGFEDFIRASMEDNDGPLI